MTITLITASNNHHRLMEFALDKTIRAVPVDAVVVACNQALDTPQKVRYVALPNSFNMLDYCNFCIKHLDQHVNTEFALICQYDGMATDPSAWTDRYFDYDYVGSLSHPHYPPVQNSLRHSSYFDDYANHDWFTCGGGLSLRSKRLLSILANDPQIQTINTHHPGSQPFVSEDLVIALLNRPYLETAYGIRFAPLEVSLKFCAEILSNHSGALGFHGWANAPLYLTEDECLFYFDHLTRSDYDSHTVPMQILKHHAMMRGYLRLREYLISRGKWLIY